MQEQTQSMDQEMKKELAHIQTSIENLDANVTAIRSFLSGNELDREDKGLVGKVNDHSMRIRKLEKQRDMAIYWCLGLAFPTGIGTWELIQKVFLH